MQSSSPPPPLKLPESYGTQHLTLIARDPQWLCAQWDFTREQLQAFTLLAEDNHLSLRIYENLPTGLIIKSVDMEPDARSWFIPLPAGPAPDLQYVAELGYVTVRGSWVTVALSRAVAPPPATIAPDRTEVFATIPLHATFAQIRQSIGAAFAKKVPLVEAVRQFHALGHAETAEGVSVGMPERRWTVEQARQLARVMGMVSIRRQMQGDLSSLVAAQILPPGGFIEPEFSTAPEFEDWPAAPTSPGGGWSGDLICVEE